MQQGLNNSKKTSSYNLKGKIAVVTSSTHGIGFATARRLAEEGAIVTISSRNKQNVDQAVGMLRTIGHNVTGVVCDVKKSEDRRKVLQHAEKLGGIDILVAFTGANMKPEPLVDCTESQWDHIFDINVKAPFFLAKESLPLIRKRQGGSIVFIGTLGSFQLVKNLAVQNASKTALLHLTKSLGQEFSEYNIRVNCIAPGYIDTKFAQIVLEDRKATISEIPLKRIGLPSDCAGVVAFLVSEDASYITGETITVAGGMHSRL